MERRPGVNDGYEDTPFIPGSKWRVHDKNRPQPRIVQPGTASTSGTPGKAPSDAVILFDGRDLSAWVREKDGSPAGWKVENGYAEVVHGTGSIRTKEQFGDCQLHIEFATPAAVESSGQGRGNSGIFLLGKYEIQVLDSSDNITYADGHVGSIYGQFPPLVNAARKPGEWQTYDIVFIAPHWDAQGKLLSPAVLTVFLNGVLVQHAQAAQGPRATKPSPAMTRRTHRKGRCHCRITTTRFGTATSGCASSRAAEWAGLRGARVDAMWLSPPRCMLWRSRSSARYVGLGLAYRRDLRRSPVQMGQRLARSRRPTARRRSRRETPRAPIWLLAFRDRASRRRSSSTDTWTQ